MIPDAHTHTYYIPENAAAVINSTTPNDWETIAQLCSRNKLLLPAFGMHPWYIDAQLCDDTELYKKLDYLLNSVPNASVGEVGLDRSTIVPINIQTEVFEKQLQIAMKHNCAVSIHCFKAYDILIPIIRQYPLRYILHGFNASAEITKQLLNLDCFFSFGHINDNQTDKLRTIVPLIPTDRLLAESDGKKNINLNDTLTTLAELTNINEAQLCKNFNKAFRKGHAL